MAVEESTPLGREGRPARPPPLGRSRYGPLQAVSWAVVYVVQGLICSRAL